VVSISRISLYSLSTLLQTGYAHLGKVEAQLLQLLFLLLFSPGGNG